MKYYFVIVLLVLSSPAVPSVFAQQAEMEMKMGPPERSATLISGLGAVHHPVSTKNAEAQRFFDQGLALIYGFNHDEAVRSFKRAAELDPKLAMAWWGIALALGPNINLDVDPKHEGSAPEKANVPPSFLKSVRWAFPYGFTE
jgi:Flp pilus assembly protein TadD